jgi:hypothetical protein
LLVSLTSATTPGCSRGVPGQTPPSARAVAGSRAQSPSPLPGRPVKSPPIPPTHGAMSSPARVPRARTCPGTNARAVGVRDKMPGKDAPRRSVVETLRLRNAKASRGFRFRGAFVPVFGGASRGGTAADRDARRWADGFHERLSGSGSGAFSRVPSGAFRFFLAIPPLVPASPSRPRVIIGVEKNGFQFFVRASSSVLTPGVFPSNPFFRRGRFRKGTPRVRRLFYGKYEL